MMMLLLHHRGARLFFSSRRRHTRFDCDWSSDVCSSDLQPEQVRCGLAEPQLDCLALAVRRRDNLPRSEERRVGKEWRARWSAVGLENKTGSLVRRLILGS